MKRRKSVNIVFSILMCFGINASSQVFTNYTTAEGLPDNYATGVAIDMDGHKWFSTVAGIVEFNDTTWTVYTVSDGLVDNFVNCIAIDGDNNVWAGTNVGVSKFDGSTWTTFTTVDSLIDDAVNYICSDPSGNIWFATYSGVSKFSGSSWTTFTVPDGLPSDQVVFVAADSVGNMWFCTQMGGLAKYDGSVFTTFNTSDSLANNNVFAIAIDNNNHKWVGTWYGLSRYDQSDFWVANYDSIDGMYNDYVRDIDVDSYGNLWVGMFADYNLDGGISMYDGSNWYKWSIGDGLIDKQVTRIAIDHDDNVWIATAAGVSEFSLSSGIQEDKSITSLQIWPNPANEMINIVSDDREEQVLEIFNSSGSIISRGNINGQTTISTAMWPDGLYLVHYGTAIQKIIILH